MRSRHVQPVEVRPLAVQRRLGRIEVLHLLWLQGAPAEGDHLAARVPDRDHEPVSEAVVIPRAFLARHREAGGLQNLVGVSLFFQDAEQSVPARQSIPELEPLDDLARQPALGQVQAGGLAGHTGEILAKVLERQAVNLQQRQAGVGLARPRAARRGERHPRPVRQKPDRLHEAETFVLHQKRDGVSAFPAAEAVEDLPLGIDHERWGFLRVERAQALVRPPRRAQREVRSDELHDIGPPEDFRDDVLGNHPVLIPLRVAPPKATRPSPAVRGPPRWPRRPPLRTTRVEIPPPTGAPSTGPRRRGGGVRSPCHG
ncbi:MAG: hypothetical protein H6Q86_5836 [candidate division NC10 bacterium]|nr:hypothetical protein [candidate division NC10 bacterium]